MASLVPELVVSDHVLFSLYPVCVTFTIFLFMLFMLFPGSPRWHTWSLFFFVLHLSCTLLI